VRHVGNAGSWGLIEGDHETKKAAYLVMLGMLSTLYKG
jgi:hypothetical protein